MVHDSSASQCKAREAILAAIMLEQCGIANTITDIKTGRAKQVRTGPSLAIMKQFERPTRPLEIALWKAGKILR